jgi:hypothetical protein
MSTIAIERALGTELEELSSNDLEAITQDKDEQRLNLQHPINYAL